MKMGGGPPHERSLQGPGTSPLAHQTFLRKHRPKDKIIETSSTTPGVGPSEHGPCAFSPATCQRPKVSEPNPVMWPLAGKQGLQLGSAFLPPGPQMSIWGALILHPSRYSILELFLRVPGDLSSGRWVTMNPSSPDVLMVTSRVGQAF